MGEEPRLALMDSDVPNAITNSMNMKATYRRVHSSLLLFLVSISLFSLKTGMASVSLAMAVSCREITQNNADWEIVALALNLFKLVAPQPVQFSRAGGNGALCPVGAFSLLKCTLFAGIRHVFRFYSLFLSWKSSN